MKQAHNLGKSVCCSCIKSNVTILYYNQIPFFFAKQNYIFFVKKRLYYCLKQIYIFINDMPFDIELITLFDTNNFFISSYFVSTMEFSCIFL